MAHNAAKFYVYIFRRNSIGKIIRNRTIITSLHTMDYPKVWGASSNKEEKQNKEWISLFIEGEILKDVCW